MKLVIDFNDDSNVTYYNVRLMNKNAKSSMILFGTTSGTDIFYDMQKKSITVYDNFMSSLINKSEFRFPALTYKNVENLHLSE